MENQEQSQKNTSATPSRAVEPPSRAAKKTGYEAETTNSEEENSTRAVELYHQGAEMWRKGDRAAAITAYTESAALDPTGPGATALELTRSIMNFYDTNQFNP